MSKRHHQVTIYQEKLKRQQEILNLRKYNQAVAGKEFNFGLLEFYRLKKLHPDFYDYLPNQRQNRKMNDTDFYSSGLYSQQSIDGVDTSMGSNYISQRNILNSHRQSDMSRSVKIQSRKKLPISLLDYQYPIDLQSNCIPSQRRVNSQIRLPKIVRIKKYRIDKLSQKAIQELTLALPEKKPGEQTEPDYKEIFNMRTIKNLQYILKKNVSRTLKRSDRRIRNLSQDALNQQENKYSTDQNLHLRTTFLQSPDFRAARNVLLLEKVMLKRLSKNRKMIALDTQKMFYKLQHRKRKVVSNSDLLHMMK